MNQGIKKNSNIEIRTTSSDISFANSKHGIAIVKVDLLLPNLLNLVMLLLNLNKVTQYSSYPF